MCGSVPADDRPPSPDARPRSAPARSAGAAIRAAPIITARTPGPSGRAAWRGTPWRSPACAGLGSPCSGAGRPRARSPGSVAPVPASSGTSRARARSPGSVPLGGASSGARRARAGRTVSGTSTALPAADRGLSEEPARLPGPPPPVRPPVPPVRGPSEMDRPVPEGRAPEPARVRPPFGERAASRDPSARELDLPARGSRERPPSPADGSCRDLRSWGLPPWVLPVPEAGPSPRPL